VIHQLRLQLAQFELLRNGTPRGQSWRKVIDRQLAIQELLVASCSGNAPQCTTCPSVSRDGRTLVQSSRLTPQQGSAYAAREELMTSGRGCSLPEDCE
jgi:hypothetical protein